MTLDSIPVASVDATPDSYSFYDPRPYARMPSRNEGILLLVATVAFTAIAFIASIFIQSIRKGTGFWETAQHMVSEQKRNARIYTQKATNRNIKADFHLQVQTDPVIIIGAHVDLLPNGTNKHTRISALPKYYPDDDSIIPIQNSQPLTISDLQKIVLHIETKLNEAGIEGLYVSCDADTGHEVAAIVAYFAKKHLDQIDPDKFKDPNILNNTVEAQITHVVTQVPILASFGSDTDLKGQKRLVSLGQDQKNNIINYLANTFGQHLIPYADLQQQHQTLKLKHQALQQKHQTLQQEHYQLNQHILTQSSIIPTPPSPLIHPIHPVVFERLRVSYADLQQQHQALQRKHQTLQQKYKNLKQEHHKLAQSSTIPTPPSTATQPAGQPLQPVYQPQPLSNQHSPGTGGIFPPSVQEH